MLRDLWIAFKIPFGATIRFENPVPLSAMKHADPEVYYTPQLSGFHFTVRDNAANPPADGRKHFSWFAMDKPDVRRPFYDTLTDLLATPAYSYLEGAVNTDFTLGSWFAVLWLPIHIKNHSQSHSAGSFLCFYLLNPALRLAGSRYRGTEPYFRSDRLAVQKPVWLLPSTLRSDEPIDSLELGGSLGGYGSGVGGVGGRTADATPVASQSAVGTPSTAAGQQQQLGGSDGGNSGFPGAPVGAPGSTASSRSTPVTNGGAPASPADGAGGPRDAPEMTSIRLPIFGIVPSRFRPEVWLRPVMDQAGRWHYVGPLYLIAAAFQLIHHEQATNPDWSDENRLVDAHFLSRHERTDRKSVV